METKRCRVCGEEKIRNLDFYPKYKTNRTTGRRTIHSWSQPCKKCRNRIKAAKSKVRYQANPELFRHRYQAYKKRWPERNRARVAVGKLVSLGRIPPASTLQCVHCGGKASEYDHHLGYSEDHKRDVQPVCRPCHRAVAIARGEYATLANGRLRNQLITSSP